MDEEQMVPLWFSDLLFYYVFSDALEYVSGVCRCQRTEAGGDSVVDMETAVALGIPWNLVPPGRCSVCFWLLQRDADFYRSRIYYNDPV